MCETNARAGTRLLALVFQPNPEWRVGLLWFVLARNPRKRAFLLAHGCASHARPLERCVALGVIMVLCVLVSRLAEHRRRTRLAETEPTIPDQRN